MLSISFIGASRSANNSVSGERRERSTLPSPAQPPRALPDPSQLSDDALPDGFALDGDVTTGFLGFDRAF
jgi:hypothetical protein